MSSAIALRGVTKTYGTGATAVCALQTVDLSVATGEFVAIMGPSGSGKSTLLALVGGLDDADSGDIWVGDRRLHDLREVDRALLRRRHIGFVFQAYNLLPVLTAAENVALPLLLDGQRQAVDRAAHMLTLVGLADRADHYPAELSGGQQQRVAIARALVTEPAILLADEPTGNLDSRSSREVLHTLHSATARLGQTVMMITHDAAVAAWANRVIFLRDGRLAGALCMDPPLLAADDTLLAQRVAAVRAEYERCVGQGVTQ